MSLNFNVRPGKIMATGEKVTNAKLNQIAVPVIQAEGTIAPADMAAGNYDAILGPGAYVYEAATLDGAIYSAEYDPEVTTYTDGLWLAFKVGAANPAAAQFDAGAGEKPIYASGGTRVPDAGEIPINTIVQVRYNSSLNAGNGGWQILNTLRDRITVFDMVGANALQSGVGGLVPTPRAGDEDKLLAGDGTFHDLTDDINDAIQATGALNPLPLFLTVNY